MMLYQDTGFRAIYNQFTCFPIEPVKALAKDFPGADEADCILTYGYIDRQAGLSLLILACGKIHDGKYRFFDTRTDIHAVVRIDAVKDQEFTIIDSEGSDLADRYKEKLEALSGYAANEEVERSRTMVFLDGSRHDEHPDDVLVYLTKDGLEPEGCWARICFLGDHYIVGELLNEPNQDFKYHMGERIAFFAHKNDDESIILVSDMNPSMQLTRKDLEDGSMLKDAIHAMIEERNEQHLIDIFELLRDSVVWIPCNAIPGEEERRFILEAIEAADGDMDSLNQSLVGKTFTAKEGIRLVPDILKNGDDYYFPAFTSEEEMGEYGERFSKIPMHFLHAISMAKNNDRDVAGIVVNAFSEPFVLNAKHIKKHAQHVEWQLRLMTMTEMHKDTLIEKHDRAIGPDSLDFKDRLDLEERIKKLDLRFNEENIIYTGLLFNISRKVADYIDSSVKNNLHGFRAFYKDVLQSDEEHLMNVDDYIVSFLDHP